MRYSIKDYSRTAAAKGWGKGWPVCTARSQTAVVTAPISGVKVVVHKRIARLVFLLLAETERRGYLLRAGQCWGGNCRAIAGTNEPSNHSWWLAVDLNSLANAYVRKINGRPVTDMPAWLPLLWNAFGFAWGGDYSGAKADAMHLEFMGSPEDADDMTALAEQRLAPGLGGTAAGGLTNLLEDDTMSAADVQELKNWMEAAIVVRLVQLLDGQHPYWCYRSDPDTEVDGKRGDGAIALAGAGGVGWVPIPAPPYVDLYDAHELIEKFRIRTVSWNVFDHYKGIWTATQHGQVDAGVLAAQLAELLPAEQAQQLAADVAAERAAQAQANADEMDRRARERLTPTA